MSATDTTPMERLRVLVLGALAPPPGRGRIALALAFGVVVHSVFGIAILTMIAAMYFGMAESFGQVSWPWAGAVNAMLLIQFPLVHSLLLTGPGGRLLRRIVPGRHGQTLATSTYAIVASIQLLLLFGLWTPSGVVWWEAQGAAAWIMTGLYALAWVILVKAIFDAGVELQSGALGWMSLLQDIAPRFPDMPTTGLFRLLRQPIYVAFALTLWTVPTWTPDQLAVAVALTAYCLLAPILKERRLQSRYGERFRAYRERVPYAVPDLRRLLGEHRDG
ncbi:MAG: isoprenylcysteine carboxylmethyltransferase family protein [Pseudomonadota bacterium]